MFSLNDLMHAMGEGTRGGHPMYKSRAGFYPGTSHPHPRCGGYEPFYNLFGGQHGSDFPTNCHKLVNEMCPGVAEVLGDILQGKCKGSKQQQQQQQQQQSAKQRQEKTTEKKAETPTPGNCGNKKDKPKYHKTSQQNETHHEPTFEDVIGNVLSAIHQNQSQHNRRQQTELRWQTKVDCRGFSLNDIKVKVDSEARQLLLKAFKKEESQNGVRTSSMRKSVALSETVDPKQVKCKLSSDGFLLVEAPFVAKRETVEREETDPHDSPHGLVGDLMTTLFPGFLGFVEDHNKTEDGEEDKKESKEMTQGEHKNCRQPEHMNGTTNQKENSQIQKSENMFDVKSAKPELNFEGNQANDKQGLVAMSSKKKSQVEPESNEDQESMKTTTTNESCETDPRAQMDAETEKSNFLEKRCDSSKCLHDPTVAYLCPENETVGAKVKDNNINEDDSSSTTSDDSFVLLSQLGQENDETSNSNQEITDNLNLTDVDCITPDDCDQNVKGQIIINASSSDVSPLEQQNMANNHQQILTQDSQNENTTVATDNHQHADSSDKKDDVVLFRLEMPSYNPDSLQVTFDQSSRVVTITATKGHTVTGSLRPSDTISRSVTLDDSVDEHGLQCFYRDGTLTVTAPRKTSVRTIPIKL